jgi:calcium-dependent protein kinase
MLLDYLRGEGASENRAMVHIENPRGVSIEDVYEGVHDGDVLGVGITGNVRLITHKETGIQRALKRLDLSHLKNKHDLDVLLDEVKIMCALDHPNIVCLEEVYEGDSELYLTQELCTGGDLFDRLDQQTNFHYTELQCARLVRQIISSVAYLHSKNIIHRDLKLENFLFQSESSESELKMIDFGLSKHFHTGELQHETVGTPYTVAPEVIMCKEGYDEKVDVWAIGVITYLLLSGDTPFGGACDGEDLMEVRSRILSGQVSFEEGIWDRVSHLAIDFIKTVLVLDPRQRPSCEELPRHPWLATMKRNSSLSDDDVSLDPRVVSGLVSFKDMSNTSKFLCEVLSFTLQPGQITGLREEFEKLDSAGMGEISLAGLKDALLARSEEFPLTDVEIEEIFNGLKLRKRDVSIRWHEFIAACLSQCQIDERNIRLAFDRLDSEHKGYLTLDDLRNRMDFYGSERDDLGQVWINDIIDYKSEKEYMTFEDFYTLLKLDRNFSSPPTQSISRAKSRHECKVSIVERRHSDIDMKHLIGFRDSAFISDMKALKTMHSVILDASKGLESHKSGPRRRATLVLRRSNQGANLSLACKSLDSAI